MTGPMVRDDAGVTLLELIVAVVLMGVITLPLANFVMAYLENYSQTESRMSDSHDIQISAAYFSQDVANDGLRNDSLAPVQSVWTTGFPAGYCGHSIGGTPLVLLMSDDPTAPVSGGTATDAVDSVAYVAVAGTLHRVACIIAVLLSDTTVVHNLVYPDATNPSPVTCPTTVATCAAVTPPAMVNLQLSLRAPADGTVSHVTLTGQRRQSAS